MTQAPPQRGLLFWSAFIGLAILTGFWAVFALASGAEEYGGGIYGLIRNSPNAIPWVVLIGVLVLAWRYPFVGGLIYVGAGVFTLLFFKTYQDAVTFVLITLPYLGLGAALAWAGRKGRG